MLEIISLLENVKAEFVCVGTDCEECDAGMAKGLYLLNEALAELKTPHWYTPEQWKLATGKVWPDEWSVYINVFSDKDGHSVFINGEYAVCKLKDAAKRINDAKYFEKCLFGEHIIICSTEAGPPPKDWRPEGKEKQDEKH
jgi:hypothetical protein